MHRACIHSGIRGWIEKFYFHHISMGIDTILVIFFSIFNVYNDLVSHGLTKCECQLKVRYRALLWSFFSNLKIYTGHQYHKLSVSFMFFFKSGKINGAPIPLRREYTVNLCVSVCLYIRLSVKKTMSHFYQLLLITDALNFKTFFISMPYCGMHFCTKWHQIPN